MPGISERTQQVLAALTAGTLDQSEYTIDELLAATSELDAAVDPTASKGEPDSKFAVIWLSNFKREYERTLQLVGVSSFLYCQLREFSVKYREDITDLGVSVETFKKCVQAFLDHHFKFNGDIHVGEMRKRNPTKAQRKRFEKIVAAERLREISKEKTAATERATAAEARSASLKETLEKLSKGETTIEDALREITTAEAESAEAVRAATEAAERIAELDRIATESAVDETLADADDDFGVREIPPETTPEPSADGETAPKSTSEPSADGETHEQTEDSIKETLAHKASRDVVAPPKETALEKTARELLLNAIPKDFASYYSTYFNDNYNALREVVETVFDVKSFLEEGIIVHDPLFDTKEEAQEYVMSQASDKLALNIIQTNNPVFTGPFRKNLDATEFSGAGWAAFKAVMDYQRAQTKDAESMLANIKKVRSQKCKYSVPADSKDVAAFAAFAEGLREEAATRDLTPAERELTETDPADEETRKDLYQKIGSERNAQILKEAEDELDEPEHADEVISQMFVSDPDTGEMTSKVIYMPTDEAQEKAEAAAKHKGAKIVTSDGAAKIRGGVRKAAPKTRVVPKKSK